MTIIRRIVKNFSALFVSQLVASLSTMILAIYIARLLGDSIFGKFAFSLAFIEIFSIFYSLGYNTVLVRDVARDKSQASRYLNNILSFRLIISIILFGIIILVINLLNYPNNTKIAVYFLGMYQLIISLSNVFKMIFRVFEKMEYEALITIFSTMLRVSSSVILLLLGYGLIEITLVFVFSAILDLLLSFIICQRKFVKVKKELDLQFLKKTLKIAVSLSMLTIFSLIYVRIDTVMLSIMKGDAVVGWYTAAYYFTDGFKPIPQLFMSALFPVMSYYFISSKESLRKIFQQVFKYLFILALPIAVGLTLTADKVIYLFYGPEFANSIIVLQILIWDVFLLFMYSCISTLLVVINKQNKMALIAGLTAVINIILNLILIPTMSYIGSAIATISAESFLLLSYIYLSHRYSFSLSLKKIIIKPLIAGGLMGIFVYYFHTVTLIVIIPFAGLLYFGLIYLLRGFSKEDYDLLRNFLKK